MAPGMFITSQQHIHVCSLYCYDAMELYHACVVWPSWVNFPVNTVTIQEVNEKIIHWEDNPTLPSWYYPVTHTATFQ